MDQHFHKLGMNCAEPYLSLATSFAQANIPPKPERWLCESGWTRYCKTKHDDGTVQIVGEKIVVPDEEMLCFDVEVMWKQSPFPVMACAVSPTAWYAWISPWLLGETENEKQLVPIGDPCQDRIVVGHNIGYDRARILEEYHLVQSRNAFIDTMSLHVAVNGMCSQQRPTWIKHKKKLDLRDELIVSGASDEKIQQIVSSLAARDEDELWLERSSINSLRDVAQFHLNHNIDKTARDDFSELDRQGIVAKLDQLLDYCAADVDVTHQVYRVVLPSFLERCPHPVSFAALRHLSSVILPVNESWQKYISTAESTYHSLSDGVRERLIGLARKALEIKGSPEKYESDPWMKQLDWSGQEIRMTKATKTKESRPVANQKMPGMPKWYKDLYPKTSGPINLTVRTRIAALLLRLSWDGNPLFWSEKYGWTFRVRRSDINKYTARKMILCDMTDEKVEIVRDNTEFVYFKLPHKDGPNARCANPLAKAYLAYFESGTLSSEYSYAKEALEMNASCSYWISARDRIRSQMVVYEKDLKQSAADSTQGFILPQVIPMGTITRRAVEKTWLTASNAKKNRVGSELKAMIKAPPGYSFVGADVDSEELWIASLVGDATFGIHGGSAIGFMTLEGTKAAGTDMHSRTASVLGITRNNAKVFNYGRIYGAGLNFAATLLRQFNHTLSDQETVNIATKLYASTKGFKCKRLAFSPQPFWRGGTESFVFNKLEEFAEQDQPRTPVLGAAITEALVGRYISKGGFLTSRINWAIQSSGVDYLHLLIVSMDYLTWRFAIDARVAITVHDEIRYLVKNCDKYRAAMALQVANLWTRAMFAQQLGIDDLPQSCAFFSAVDIDTVLRKEVNLDCITPSNPEPIPPGESLNIYQLLEKGEDARLDPSISPKPQKPVGDSERSLYVPRIPVIKDLDDKVDSTSPAALNFIRAQITNSNEELKEILKVQKQLMAPASRGRSKPVRTSVKGDAEDDGDYASGYIDYRSVPQLQLRTIAQLENMNSFAAFKEAWSYSLEMDSSSSHKWAPNDPTSKIK